MSSEFQFGRGKISASLSLFFSLLSLGGVICFYFPSLFSTAELRSLYPISLIRFLIDFFIVVSSILSLISMSLGYKVYWPLLSLVFALTAALLGGGHVSVGEFESGLTSLGLDWFLLDIFLLSVVFIPFEKLFPLKTEQKIFRNDLKLDVIYFAFNHFFFQALFYFSGIPARIIETSFGKWSLGEKVASIPFWAQLLIVLFMMDLFQYIAHRAFHQFRFLWKFHAIHHSVEEMDWIAGSRLHLIDVLITRAWVFIPFHLAGFRTDVMEVYAVLAAFQTVFIHSNLRFRMDFLNYIIATPSYHHWHHSSDKEALDKNFAVHLPLLDLIFGTYHHPKGQWPKNYGLYREKIPSSFWKQFFYPFK